jgi:flagellar biosynthesis protein FlhB
MSIVYVHGLKTFASLLWIKVITLALIYFFISSYKKKEFYYYQNLGVSKRFLWISSIALDIVLFVLLIILTLNIR